MNSSNKVAKAFPAKRFFVDMLVRDIELQDAILDLLDNCVDGAMRSIEGEAAVTPKKPYEGFEAKINFNSTEFTISDNCGGIPIDLAETYAFRLGRADLNRDKDLPTVGVYGIGMKRAVFKLGKKTEIFSKTKTDGFKLSILPKWLEDDDDWELPLEIDNDSLTAPGTKIVVSNLRDGIPRLFLDETDFTQTLKSSISAYYGYIIDKGFSVYVNNEKILPIKLSLFADDYDKEGITPYVYEGEIDGVTVAITIGMYRPFAKEEEEDAALHGRPSSEHAGITVVCNDRVVIFADKTRVTGWGEATVPQYHTQFISIAGTVVFKSNDARKLPLTTTKRGIDGNSEIYLSAKEFMREGIKIFSDFTNKWKKSSKELQVLNSQLSTIAPEAAHRLVPEAKWASVTRGMGGKKYKPNLPLPKEDDPFRQIKFSRKQSEIAEISNYLFDESNISPGDVGGKCFDDTLVKARK